MFGLATVKAKLIVAAIIVAIIGLSGFYIRSLHHSIDGLKKANVELNMTNKAQEDTIKETKRREDIVNQVTSLGDEERVKIKKVYETKIQKVEKYVQEGKDKPVGPLLNEFFNN